MIDPIQYIRQHLMQRDLSIEFQDFRFLAFSTESFYQINACNHHLFVEINKLPLGTRVIGENNAIEITERHKEVQAWEEFSGIVTITLKQDPPKEESEEYKGGIEYILILSSSAK